MQQATTSNSAVVVNDLVLKGATRSMVADMAYDLKLIRRAVPAIDCIIVRGGSVIDVLSGRMPSDIDLFYSWLENGEHVNNCKCDALRAVISELPFRYFQLEMIDLENAYEKEPRFDPIERTVGLFSYHSDYISMFCLDENGLIWSRSEAVRDSRSNTYEARYEGYLPWAYFSGNVKSKTYNYYEFMAYSIIRGLRYMMKRNSIPGVKFTELVRHADLIFQNAIKARGAESLNKYALAKIGDRNALLQALARFEFDADAKIRIEETLLSLLGVD